MKKIYNIITGSVLSIMLTLSSINGVSAATSLGYTATVAAATENYLITTVNPSQHYQWALNYMPTINGERITSKYYSAYATGSFELGGPEITINGSKDGYSAIWTPNNLSSLPVFFGTNSDEEICSGKAINSNYCALSGYRYRLYLKNTFSKSVTVSGQFTLTEY